MAVFPIQHSPSVGPTWSLFPHVESTLSLPRTQVSFDRSLRPTSWILSRQRPKEQRDSICPQTHTRGLSSCSVCFRGSGFRGTLRCPESFHSAEGLLGIIFDLSKGPTLGLTNPEANHHFESF